MQWRDRVNARTNRQFVLKAMADDPRLTAELLAQVLGWRTETVQAAINQGEWGKTHADRLRRAVIIAREQLRTADQEST